MSLRTRNILYSLVLLLSVFAVWLYRKPKDLEPIFLEGETMATTYHVTYYDVRDRNFKSTLDSILVKVNRAINNYDTASEVSRFNRATRGTKIDSSYFRGILKTAWKVYEDSDGAYDPTVMPLVNAWGFGPAKGNLPDSSAVDSLKQLVDFSKIRIVGDSLIKTDPRLQLDFGGIGQGFGADAMAGYLSAMGVTDFLVELGGEGVARGKNLKEGRYWQLGILDPDSDPIQMTFYAELSLRNQAFSTSGNYFNYRIVNGRKYSHTIDPDSGYPVERPILSSTVLAGDCATADAWATAFMVMGHEQGQEVSARYTGLDVLFIFSGPGTVKSHYLSDGIKAQVSLMNP